MYFIVVMIVKIQNIIFIDMKQTENINNRLLTALPFGVVYCGEFQGTNNCGGECVGENWFSKINNGDINAPDICKDWGYIGTVTQYGGNFGDQCRKPVQSSDSPTSLGHTVSWKCEGK